MDRLIDQLKELSAGHEVKIYEPRFKVGDRIRVTRGRFAGSEGTVKGVCQGHIEPLYAIKVFGRLGLDGFGESYLKSYDEEDDTEDSTDPERKNGYGNTSKVTCFDEFVTKDLIDSTMNPESSRSIPLPAFSKPLLHPSILGVIDTIPKPNSASGEKEEDTNG